VEAAAARGILMEHKYIMGVDVGSATGSKTTTCSIEVCNGCIHVLGEGQPDDAAMAMAITLHAYIHALPWYKRWWARLKLRWFGVFPQREA
jgi:hypothetical protein